jgi:hypothetical protein
MRFLEAPCYYPLGNSSAVLAKHVPTPTKRPKNMLYAPKIGCPKICYAPKIGYPQINKK